MGKNKERRCEHERISTGGGSGAPPRRSVELKLLLGLLEDLFRDDSPRSVSFLDLQVGLLVEAGAPEGVGDEVVKADGNSRLRLRSVDQPLQDGGSGNKTKDEDMD